MAKKNRQSTKGQKQPAQAQVKKEHHTPEGKLFKVRTSWNTDDEYEIELRRVRALEENAAIEPKPSSEHLFGDYRVAGKNGCYTVELRSLHEPINTCTCKDFQKNFLGTCKHIEHVLQAAGKLEGESPYYEIYMGRNPYQLRLLRPFQKTAQLSALLDMYFSRNGAILSKANANALLDSMDQLPESLKERVRISREARQWVARQDERMKMEKLRSIMEREMEEHGGELPFLKEKLYDYQREGMLHLAFKGRAILADDMGLGKTVQAIAAAAVMRHIAGIRKVLVVSPTSLKLEWEEQIHKFTDFSCEAVFGNRPQRLHFYKETDSFFILMNYEQVLRDAEDIMSVLKPDLMILDEAQRIKNWTTQTARTLKQMETPYIFVLTGTPLENRIDDIYSLAEIVDPTILGSLFRFNRRYYKFDADGRNVGMQHLDELHEKLTGIMLRRRKSDVDMPLPERTDRNLFVPMTDEQQKRYGEENYKLQILLNTMKKRPLNQEEFQRMQLHLAMMRMLCDSCYITDPEITDSPKLDEAMEVIHDYLNDDETRKIIIFSEWTRMLDLLKERLEKERICYVEHTGSIPQQKRRTMLATFKNDKNCRLLLSSEAGGTGLNLQVASVVFNLDLPWNPARLEQRIARVWRNKQSRNVEVINFVATGTIEHNMLGTLKFKTGLADLVLDGNGDQSLFGQQKAKDAFIKRLQELLSIPQAAPKPRSISQKVLDSKLAISQLFSFADQEGKEHLLGVGEATAENVQTAVEDTRPTTVISAETMAVIQQLAQLGVISIHTESLKQIYQAGATGEETRKEADAETRRRAEIATRYLEEAQRPVRMAKLLLTNEFQKEAYESLWKASESIMRSLSVMLYGDMESSRADDTSVIRGEAFAKLVEDCPLDRQSRVFLEMAYQKLSDDSLMERCEHAVANLKDYIQLCLHP